MAAQVSFGYGGIVFGGANWRRLALYSNQATSRDSGAMACGLSIKGNDLTGIEVDTWMQEIMIRLRKTNESFSIVRGSSRAEMLGSTAATVDAAGNILVTYGSGYTLTDEDIGQVAQFEVEVAGVYQVAGSFQIVGYETVAPNFYISEPVWIPGISDYFNSASFLGKNVRVKFGTAQYVVSQEQKITGVGFRPSVEQTGDADDVNNQRRLRFSGAWQVTANTLHPDGEYRFAVDVTEQFATNGTGVVVFSGVVTAGRNASSDPVGARDLLAVAMTNFIANTLTNITAPDVATFEDVFQPILNYDEFQNALSFQYAKRRLIYDELQGIVDDPRISNAQIGIERNYSNEHGLQATNSPPSATITYSCAIQAVGNDKISPSEIKAFWIGTLKKYLIDTVQTVIGGTLTILAAKDLVYSPVTSGLAASITFLVTGQTSSVMLYQRNNSVNHNTGVEDLKANDGRDYDFVEFNRGQDITGVTSITVVSLEQMQSAVSQSFTRSIGLTATGKNSEPMAVMLSQAGTTDVGNTDGQYRTIINPGDPNTVLGYEATKGPGEWRFRSARVNHTPRYIKDIDNLASRIKIVTSEFVSLWRWRSDSSSPSSTSIDEGSSRFSSKNSTERLPEKQSSDR